MLIKKKIVFLLLMFSSGCATIPPYNTHEIRNSTEEKEQSYEKYKVSQTLLGPSVNGETIFFPRQYSVLSSYFRDSGAILPAVKMEKYCIYNYICLSFETLGIVAGAYGSNMGSGKRQVYWWSGLALFSTAALFDFYKKNQLCYPAVDEFNKKLKSDLEITFVPQNDKVDVILSYKY